MRRVAILALLAVGAAAPALADDVTASGPSDLAVTIYRDPDRNGGAMRLDALGGFAVVSETRRVTIPAGVSRLRLVGVVDGIIPESAVVSGLGDAVFEKNQDNATLSPAALLRATRGKTISLRRTDRATGKPVMTAVRIVSASEEGVVFAGPQGTETLRCSGYPETFSYGVDTSGLAAQPVLSVGVRSARSVTATVKLTYLAQGFDWNASYTAAVAPDGGAFDLGGWITLANANTVSLPAAAVQIVAGGLNREVFDRVFDPAPRAVAKCWTIRTTSDIPRKPERPYELVRPFQPYVEESYALDAAADIVVTGATRREMLQSVPLAVMAMPAPAPPPPPEQLGDLKLYRIPGRTTVAASQMKQTRLLDKPAVGFTRHATLTLEPLDPNVGEYLSERVGDRYEVRNAATILRTRNDTAHGLGIPLPAGAFLIDQAQSGRTMLLGEPVLRDTAEDEKIELALGAAPDITLKRRTVSRGKRVQRQEVSVANASPEPVELELRYATYGTLRLDDADAPLGREDGQAIFKLRLEPNTTRVVRYTVRWD